MNSIFKAAIAGTGAYLPEKILTNRDLEKSLDTSDEWITTRTGIKERRIAAEHESASTMAAIAARQALESAEVNSDDVDMIIVCTSTPDVLFPSTACFVQKELQAFNSAAYDITAVCSGFVFGLSIAEQYIKAGRYEHILVIGSEANSRIVDWSDRSTCILFGDGAGAVLLKRIKQEEIDRRAKKLLEEERIRQLKRRENLEPTRTEKNYVYWCNPNSMGNHWNSIKEYEDSKKKKSTSPYY